MAKETTEVKLRESLKVFGNKVWFMKIQQNPLSGYPSPADFLVLTEDSRILIECKQTNLSSSKSFSMKRLTQEMDLIQFERAFNSHRAYVLLCFWGRRMDKSYYFMLPIDAYLTIKGEMGLINRKSINYQYLLDRQKQYLMPILKGSLLDIWEFLYK